MKTSVWRILLCALTTTLILSAALPSRASAGEADPPPPDPTPVISDEAAVPEDEAAAEGETALEEPAPSSNEEAEDDGDQPSEESLATDEAEAIEEADAEPPDGPVSPEALIESEAVEEPAGDEAEELPAEEDLAAEAPEETVGSLLAELPEDTSLIVLDETGEALPLASQEAAEVIAGSDPIWCPAGATPPVGGGPALWAGGCSPSFGSMSLLVGWLNANDPNVNGVIWIEKTYNSTVNATLNGSTLVNMSAKTLTVQGGWNGLGTKTFDINNPSEISHSISILGWLNDVTLSDLVFTGVTGVGNTALVVETSGKITLNRAEVSDNQGPGARLDNRAGTKDVAVSNSRFENNEGGHGLEVLSNGAITLVSVIGNGNGDGTHLGNGVRLNNSSAPAAKNVTITSGTFQFNNNSDTGLVIWSKGLISLKDIDAIGNGTDGAYLDNLASTTYQGVTLTGTNVFADNSNSGLVVWSKGTIKINNLIANSNTTQNGAALHNNWENDKDQPVILTGFNEFKFNGANGLLVASTGAITLSNITASNNTLGSGVSLDNWDSSTSQGVTLTGTNTFNNNGDAGLGVWSLGAIAVSNLTAEGNGSDNPTVGGVYLDNFSAGSAKPVSITGFASVNWNLGRGLYITSRGAISVANLTANGNGGKGAKLSNAAAYSSLPVTVTGKAETQLNDDSGLEIYSWGAITVNNIFSSDNGGYGAYLQNDYAGTAAVTVNGTAGFAVGTGGFFSNGASGLEVYSRGAVTLKDIDSYGNGGYGLYVDNRGGTGNVTLGTALKGLLVGAIGNADIGIGIYTNGVVVLSNIYAWSNGGSGVDVENWEASTPKAVTLSGTNSFGENAGAGISVWSRGTVTLNNVFSSYNDVGGVYVDNCLYDAGLCDNPTVSPVKLTGYATMYDNGWHGLRVWSLGAISVNNLEASGNGGVSDVGHGAWLYNAFNPASPQGVTITGYADLDENFQSGLEVFTYGAITITNLSASDNGWGADLDEDKYGYGANLVNRFNDSIKTMPVTLNGSNTFNGNWSGGLLVDTLDAIKANNLTASYNHFFGAVLDNCHEDEGTCTVPAVKPLTITGFGEFSQNGGVGLYAASRGAITAANLSAYLNGLDGVILDNSWNLSVGAVTITGDSDFGANGGSGLTVNSLGAIKGNNLSAWTNSGEGIHLDNDWLASTTSATLTLTGYTEAGNNGSDGLYILSWRAVTIANLYTDTNGGFGAWIDNTDSGEGSPQNVTLTGANKFYGNGFDGLYITTYGVISVSNLTANDNGALGGSGGFDPDFVGPGAWLDNSGGITPKDILLTGSAIFNGNAWDGLVAMSLGNIKVNNLTANWNGRDGASIDNRWGGAKGGVFLTGTNHVEGNADGTGLYVESHGAITISNLTAAFNGFGAYLYNRSTTTASVPVTLSGASTFKFNGGMGDGHGLMIDSDSQINLNTISAFENTGTGVYLNNYDGWFGTPVSAIPGIKLTGTNNFSFNGLDGLYFKSLGLVDLKYVTADGNADGFGVRGSTDGNIIFACGSLTNNLIGWFLAPGGTVTLRGVFALGNGTNEWLASGMLTRIRTCP
ncbi:MAG: hypothetical protein WD751_03240 [Anaerolineales bacterium]